MKRALLLAASLLLPSASLAANPLARFAFDPTLGHFDLELCEETSTSCLGAAPNTVANFMQYLNRGDYGRGSFIHRDVAGFVIQGGSFSIDANGQLGVVPDLPPVANEYNQPNVRGTVAVPLIGNSSNPCDTQPDSGTSGFFVNLVDNSQDLDCGKFTVFAVVAGNGMQTADRIGNLMIYNLGAQFSTVPLLDTYPCTPINGICSADYTPYLVYYTAHPLLFDDGTFDPAADSLLSDFDTPRQRADDFTLSGAAPVKLGALQWWGQYRDSNAAVALDDFRIRVFADDGGGVDHLPTGAPLFERALHNILRGDTGVSGSNGFHVFEYLATFPAFELPPGRYWLSIVNDTTADPTSSWYWARSNGAAGDERVRNQDGDPWSPDGVGPGTLAFALMPEPGAEAEGLAALLAIFALRRARSCG
jgi:cyclophilin family peptidyl-prolyl cis-trans isomerase